MGRDIGGDSCPALPPVKTGGYKMIDVRSSFFGLFILCSANGFVGWKSIGTAACILGIINNFFKCWKLKLLPQFYQVSSTCLLERLRLLNLRGSVDYPQNNPSSLTK